MKTLVKLLLAVSLTFSVQAFAANIYQSGSLANKMYEHIAPVLPATVIPIFVLASDKTYFAKQIDRDLLIMQGVSIASLTKAVNSVKPALSSYAAAYTSGGFIQAGKESEMRLCEIVFTDLQYAKNTSTLFHEAMHCKTGVLATTRPYIQAITPAFRSQKAIGASQFKAQFEEAIAAVLQVAYAANGLVDGGLEGEGYFGNSRSTANYEVD